MREYNKLLIEQYRATGGHRPAGTPPFVLVTTTGAVTGRPHTTPVCVREAGTHLVIAGSAGGRAVHPQWVKNLLANPEVTVEYMSDTYQARAVIVENSPDRDRLFNMMSEVIDGLYRYQDRCRETRQIPIIRLERIDSP